MAEKRIIVIGGGPAGLLAAIQAAEAGAEVLLLEKMKQTGRKLCITGKGRCNITNIAELSDFIEHFGPNGNFLRQAFARFFSNDLMALLEKSGLPLITERGGRVFPASGKAPDVLKTLQSKLSRLNVKTQNSAPVTEILYSKNTVTGVITRNEKFECNSVILATGGASYPATGSTGDGYKLAESAGHSIVPIRPTLVPLETRGNSTARMDKLNLRNINASLLVNGKTETSAFGELVFTSFGVTGPVILTLSGEAVDALTSGAKVSLSIDLKPALDKKKLDARLLRDFSKRGTEPMSSILRGLVPKQMVPVCLESTNIKGKTPGSRITAEERGRLRGWLKDFRMDVTKHRPFKEAIITAGGISLKEVDPKTMESRIMKKLYIAGEVLDIQADTGGYNLQAAFSTGWLAGKSAAESR